MGKRKLPKESVKEWPVGKKKKKMMKGKGKDCFTKAGVSDFGRNCYQVKAMRRKAFHWIGQQDPGGFEALLK